MFIIEHTCYSYCEICGKDLSERIKVLEDALKQILEYGDRTWKEGIARAALEVKHG
jgi:DNA primase catalytic subunit